MSFNNIIGQKRAKEIIIGQLASAQVPHGYLFLGQDGVGRKKTALELAKALCCQSAEGNVPVTDPCDHCLPCGKINRGIHPDVQIIDFLWQAQLENKDVEKQKTIKIDTIRALQHEISLKAAESKWKIFILEPAEKITLDAANCLLKTLEEPPQGTVLILLAKHKENLPATIVSRAQIVRFSPLAESEIADYLAAKCALKDEDALGIARASEGSLSLALAMISEKSQDTESFYLKLSRGGLTSKDALSASQQNAKNAKDFLKELLSCAKTDFRARPGRSQVMIEQILYSQKLLEKNVNPQMILDVLLMKVLL